MKCNRCGKDMKRVLDLLGHFKWYECICGYLWKPTVKLNIIPYLDENGVNQK